MILTKTKNLIFQKWLEVSSKRRNGPACCELCQYQYLRHKKFVVKLKKNIFYNINALKFVIK